MPSGSTRLTGSRLLAASYLVPQWSKEAHRCFFAPAGAKESAVHRREPVSRVEPGGQRLSGSTQRIGLHLPHSTRRWRRRGAAVPRGRQWRRWRWRHGGANAKWRAASPAAGQRSGAGILPARAWRNALGIIPPGPVVPDALRGIATTRGDGKHHANQKPGVMENTSLTTNPG